MAYVLMVMTMTLQGATYNAYEMPSLEECQRRAAQTVDFIGGINDNVKYRPVRIHVKCYPGQAALSAPAPEDDLEIAPNGYIWQGFLFQDPVSGKPAWGPTTEFELSAPTRHECQEKLIAARRLDMLCRLSRLRPQKAERYPLTGKQLDSLRKRERRN
jgi:hypothetical protein